VCSAAGQVVSRGGPLADIVCKACADACKRCGDACLKVSADDMMKKCADECFRCEKACQEMLQHVGHNKTEKGTEKGDFKDKSDK
jgi:hypothetical protein